MKITFLGTSHGYCEEDRFCSSAALTVGNTTYLIDAGAPITGLMLKHKLPLDSVRAIFLTHKHPDHWFGLHEFAYQMNNHYYKKKYPTAHFEIYASEVEPFEQLLGSCAHTPISDLKLYTEGLFYEDENIRVTAFPTEHIPNAFGFLIEAEGKKIAFSGDLKGGYSLYPSTLTETDLDVAVVESAHAKYTDPEVFEKLSRTRTKRFLINHYFHGKNPPEVIEEFAARTRDRFETILTHDGDVFTV